MEDLQGKTGRQRFGAHMSIAGGLHRAFEAGRQVGCECMQIFLKNQRQWEAKPLTSHERALWRAAWATSSIRPVIAHDSYLINLASPDRRIWRRSVAAFVDELRRCAALGIRYLVTHPGSHMGTGEAAGVRRVVQALDEAYRRSDASNVVVLLETTAGQGSNIGYRFEHLADIIGGMREPDRLGICFDTCHAFVAGYPLAPAGAYAETMDALDRTVGLWRVHCIHVNDSRRPCGSRVDRHEHIGRGQIGRDGFANLLADARFFHVPKILETPKGKDARGCDWDVVNLRVLRRLARGVGGAH